MLDIICGAGRFVVCQDVVVRYAVCEQMRAHIFGFGHVGGGIGTETRVAARQDISDLAVGVVRECFFDAVFTAAAAENDEDIDAIGVFVLFIKDRFGDACDLLFGERASVTVVRHDVVVQRSDASVRVSVYEQLHFAICRRSAVAFYDNRAVVCDGDIPADVGQLGDESSGFYRKGFGFAIERDRLVLEYGQYLGVVGIDVRLADKLSARAVDENTESAVADLISVCADLHERMKDDLYAAVDVERVYLDDADGFVVDAVEHRVLVDECFCQRAGFLDERTSKLVTFGAGHAFFDHADTASHRGTSRLDDEFAVFFKECIKRFGRRLFDLDILASCDVADTLQQAVFVTQDIELGLVVDRFDEINIVLVEKM